MQLDLHGIRHYQVDREVENFVYLNQHALRLTIICGNSHKMIELVTHALETIGCEISWPRYGTVIIRRL